MKIIVVLHKAKKKGGAVVQILRIFDFIKANNGSDVYIFSMDDYNIFRNPIKTFLKTSKKLKEIIDDFKPDIILTSDPFFTTTCALRASRRRIPIVLRIGAVYDAFYAGRIQERNLLVRRSNLIFKFVKNLLKFFSKIIIKRVSIVVFNSFFLQNIFNEVAPKSIVIHNGVKTMKIIPKKINSQIKLVYVGRIEPRKSLEILFETIYILSKTDVNFIFTLIGSIEEFPKYWKKLEYYLAQKNLMDYVDIYGYIENENLPIILQKQDVLLFPTDGRNFPVTEGLPNVLLEGMVNGLLIIATNVAGVSEILKTDGGIIVEPEPKDFAQAITKIYKSRNEFNKWKLDNIRYIENNFKLEKACEKYVGLFQNIIEDK